MMMTARLSDAIYRSVFELSPVAMYLLDAEGNFLSANSAGEQLLRAAAHEIAGTNIVSTYLPGELASHAAPVEKSSGSVSRFERIFLRRDGSSIPVESRFPPCCRKAVRWSSRT